MSTDPTLAKDRVLPAYLEQYAALTGLFDELSDTDWRTPSDLPGWDVQAIAAHLMGTEYMLLGEEPTGSEEPTVSELAERPHVHNEIAARNELWVESLRDNSPDQLRTRWSDIVQRRTATMRELTDDQWHAASWSPVGDSTLSRFMRIRVFDLWLHEQDIRDATRRPAHEHGAAANAALDEISTALGYIVGRKAKAPDGSSVTIELTDADRAFHVVVDGRAQQVDALDDPTTTLRMSTGTFARLTGGRGDVVPLVRDVEVSGDTTLGAQIAHNLAFTI